MIAGNGSYGVPVSGPALSSPLGQIQGIGVDASGDVYLGDPNNRVVEEVVAPSVPSAPTGVPPTAPVATPVATVPTATGPTAVVVYVNA